VYAQLYKPSAATISVALVGIEWRLDSHLSGSLSVFNLACVIDGGIMRPQRRNQLGQCSKACNFAEVRLGFQQTSRGPSQNRAALPAFYAARCIAKPAETGSRSVGGGQHPLQAFR
jgi:hypothetical protein